MNFDYPRFVRDRIEQLRNNRGMSKRLLSESIGKSSTYLTDLTRHNSLPSMGDFFAICEVLEITPEHFFSTSSRDYQLFFSLYCALEKIMPAHDLEVLVDALAKMDKKDYEAIRRFLLSLTKRPEEE